jgi:hypothetical protein
VKPRSQDTGRIWRRVFNDDGIGAIRKHQRGTLRSVTGDQQRHRADSCIHRFAKGGRHH